MLRPTSPVSRGHLCLTLDVSRLTARAVLIPIRAGKFGEWILGDSDGFYLRGRCQGLLAPGMLTLGSVSLNFYACLHEKLNRNVLTLYLNLGLKKRLSLTEPSCTCMTEGACPS